MTDDTNERLPMAPTRQPTPPRPSLSDESVRRRAAESIMPDIIRWLGGDFRENEREDYIKDLLDVMHERDGFEAAYKLKRDHYWEANAELVEILDGSWAWRVVDEAIREWVAANGITPDLAVGQLVKTKHGVGQITNLDADMACYVVQTEEFLNKSPDQKGRASGYVIPFEQCEAVPEPETPGT